MKKILVPLLAILIYTSCFSQQTEPQRQLAKQDYLQKSKNRKTIAWLFVGGGAALVITGAVIPRGEQTGNFFYASYKNDDTRAALIICGILSGMGSIPFFIASHSSKIKANRMSFNLKFEKSNVLRQTGFVNNYYPALSFKVIL